MLSIISAQIQRIQVLAEYPDLILLLIDGKKYECYNTLLKEKLYRAIRIGEKYNCKEAFKLVNQMDCHKCK